MRLKLDENLSGRTLKRALQDLEHDVEMVQDEKLVGHPDTEILERARNEARLLLTADRHLRSVTRFPPGTHSGIVFFNLRKPLRTELITFIVEFVKNAPLKDFAGRVVEVKLRGYRVLESESEN